MADSSSPAQTLQAALVDQFADALHQNDSDRERIKSEIADRTAELERLDLDRDLIVALQDTVSSSAPSTATTDPAVTEPLTPVIVPDAVESSVRSPQGSPVVPAARRTKKSSPGRSASTGTKVAAAAASQAPSVAQLVREYMTSQAEPVSAKEVADALNSAHPERAIKTGSVREALRGLVAKGRVARSEQGGAVFYQDVPGDSVAVQASAEEREPATSS